MPPIEGHLGEKVRGNGIDAAGLVGHTITHDSGGAQRKVADCSSRGSVFADEDGDGGRASSDGYQSRGLQPSIAVLVTTVESPQVMPRD